jgi:KDO2-lipid IV(A) lauroyltransferase
MNSAAAIILAPAQYLVKAILLFLLRMISRLPLPVLHGLGAGLGWLALLRGRYRRRLRDNLETAGLYRPGLVAQVSKELGKGVVEMPQVWLSPVDRVYGRVREVRGWQHLEAALGAGKGVLLLAPHLGCFEICGMYISSKTPTTALYTPPPQAWVHAMMREGRERSGGKTVPPDTSGVRALLTRLRAGEAVFILPDQTANKGEGQWLRFLDAPAYMPSLPYRLLERTGATPLIVFAKRLSWGRGYRLYIEPIPGMADAGPEGQARAVNQAMSVLIRQHPEQYLWNYNIYRRRRDMPPVPDTL